MDREQIYKTAKEFERAFEEIKQIIVDCINGVYELVIETSEAKKTKQKIEHKYNWFVPIAINPPKMPYVQMRRKFVIRSGL